MPDLRRRHTIIALLAMGALSMLLFRCASSPVASTGGWGSETTNGAVIAGVILDSTGTGVPDVNVMLHMQMATAADPVAAVRVTSTGLAGRYRFDSVAVGRYMVEALTPDSSRVALVSQVVVAQPTDTLNVSDTVAHRGILTGAVDAASDLPLTAVIEKTPYRVAVGANGTYSFPVVPPGRHRVFAVTSAVVIDGGGVIGLDTVDIVSGQAAVADTIRRNVLAASATPLTFDDFEDGDFAHALGHWWWTFDDSLNGGNSYIERLATETIPGMPGAAGSSYALRVAYQFGPARGPGAFVGAGTRFGHLYSGIGSEVLDLSNVKALRFQARGVGGHVVSVQLNSACGTSKSMLMDIDTLSSQWVEYRIAAADLAARYDTSTVPWPVRARSAMELLFVVTGSPRATAGELWIDNVVLER